MSSPNEVTSVVNGSVEKKTAFLTTYVPLEPIKKADEARAEAPPGSQLEQLITQTYFKELVELRRLNSQLQARNEELQIFAYTVAHQLKSSSCIIIMLGNILKEYINELPQEVQPYLNGIIQTGYKMNNVISEVQLLAGIRESNVELKPLNIGKIVAEARQRLAYVIKERQAHIIAPAEWPVAWGYGPWIEEVWVNYIDNAIKYGGEPPRVELGATLQANDLIRFWVRDNGPGLPPEKQTRVFQPFIRLNQIKAEGHGLGLPIVQHIVEKLNGQVGVESQGVPGQGSTFMFTLSARKS